MTISSTIPTDHTVVAPAGEAILAERADVLAHPDRYRVLTGDRPTGSLHLGHYLGTLRERVRLQDAGVETFVVVADYQVITDRVDTSSVATSIRELVLDYLACGIDPARTTVFVHSAVPEIGQLMLPLLSATTLSELQRNPTVKAEVAESGSSAIGGLMLTYPVHQAADILSVGGTLVPVGGDQLPHLEQARAVARRINERYGDGRTLLTPPQALLTEAPRLLGTDGRKMAKSRGNAIAISATDDETARLVRGAVTDSLRHITYDPQLRPEVSSLLLVAALCTDSTPQRVADQIGSGGAAGLKAVVTEAVNEHIRPIRVRRRELEQDPAVVREVLREGLERARPLAVATLARVHQAMGLDYGLA
ncbi:tryptophan--tRNA ligase [Angustibacter sp. McL0619]|uniref:tryptophan--tRNA ligase n=1 Tax=Angustibacter sp. McL0619 TaxID=3415676 RepID=UPI003CE9C6B0